VSQIKPSSLNSPPSRLAPQGSGPADRGIAEFEALYRANVAAVTAYFARRSAEPQTVADLTAGTFVQAITSFATFDPRKGTPRAWVLSVAGHPADAAAAGRARLRKAASPDLAHSTDPASEPEVKT
jgi:DNA-directed RNA polymerase specialized sigma24 family protein